MSCSYTYIVYVVDARNVTKQLLSSLSAPWNPDMRQHRQANRQKCRPTENKTKTHKQSASRQTSVGTECSYYARLIFSAMSSCLHHGHSFIVFTEWLRVPERIAFRLAVHACIRPLPLPSWLGTRLPVSWSGACLRRRLTYGSDFALRRLERCGWSSHSTRHHQRPCFYRRCTGRLDRNSLSEDVRSTTSLPVFWRRMKLELFKRSFGPRHSTRLTFFCNATVTSRPWSFTTLRHDN